MLDPSPSPETLPSLPLASYPEEQPSQPSASYPKGPMVCDPLEDTGWTQATVKSLRKEQMVQRTRPNAAAAEGLGKGANSAP
ncbi:hypothetical protein UY3_18534 [Chelonia mydas]|uniref:Uncharacterized protein n=1 Tax=Chelonia mydas TaxID=8469 RepID=M7AIW3_CHEMY|nr:hypothetical protein UY3_18534 [Chelonia mydas]